jgi:putative ABC transport system permease protein
MNIIQIALREVGRRKMRTLYTASGIALAVALLIATITVGGGGYQDLTQTINRYGHQLTILPATTNETSLQGFGIGGEHYIPEDAIPDLQEVYEQAIVEGWRTRDALILIEGFMGDQEQVDPATFAPRVYAETELKGRDIVFAGIEPRKEYIAKFWWEVDAGNLIRRDDEIMLGKILASATRTQVGDEVGIAGETYRVAGILQETNSPDDYMAFATLPTVQRAFNREGQVSLISVRAMCAYCPVGEAELAINQGVVGVRATSQRDIAAAQAAIFSNVFTTVVGFVIMAFVIACMAVFNMIMGSLHARIREVGLLKVLGASHAQLARLFMYEAALIGLIGGLLGYLIGVGIAYLLGPIVMPDVVIRWEWEHVALAVGAALGASLLATLYPAFRACNARPVEAFRAL